MQKFRIFKQVPKIIFGQESILRIDEIMPRLIGNNYCLYILDEGLPSELIKNKIKIKQQDIVEWFDAKKGEPKTNQVDEMKKRVLNKKNNLHPTVIVGIGGGSTMDIAKALSVMFTNDGLSSQYQGWDLVKNNGIYKIGIPSISGSGSEASRTAVLMGNGRKLGINSDYSMFDAVILDSNLIKSVPNELRFYSGMDCYIHCVESLSGTMINELAKANASKALELCENVFLRKGTDDELMVASFMGGVSIVNSEVGICHALSYGLSVELGLRHGLANCIVFNVLEEFYKEYVTNFHTMIHQNSITLPKNICDVLDQNSLDRMVEITYQMERPLINALGENWKKILTKEKIISLYKKM